MIYEYDINIDIGQWCGVSVGLMQYILVILCISKEDMAPLDFLQFIFVRHLFSFVRIFVCFVVWSLLFDLYEK